MPGEEAVSSGSRRSGGPRRSSAESPAGAQKPGAGHSVSKSQGQGRVHPAKAGWGIKKALQDSLAQKFACIDRSTGLFASEAKPSRGYTG